MKRLSVTLALTSLLFTPLARADEASEKAAAKLLEQKLKSQNPEQLAILAAVKGKDVVVVRGSMDHIEHVLAAAKIRHTVIAPEEVGSFDLQGEQILMVNCPGNIPQGGVAKIEKFVRAGGLLYTTDWTLLNLVQKAFPGTIVHNGASTGNEVTHVHVHAKHEDLMSNMLLRKDRDPQWWLEGGSYPIKIVDDKRVQVLASSSEMGKKYGASPVVVRFKWDDGEVIHVVSHFYRQMDAQGPAVAAKNAVDQIEGLSAQQKAEFKQSDGAGASIGNVESSYAFQRMTTNLITGKASRNQSLRQEYRWTPSSSVVLEGRKVQKGERLKVLGKNGRKVRVRDDRGNEGELDAAQVQALQ